MRTFAPPSEGDVVCTRKPFVSLSSIETSPGVIMSFSWTSSPGTTSTRIGWSSSRLSVRVLATTVTVSSTAGSGCRSTTTSCCEPAATCTVAVSVT